MMVSGEILSKPEFLTGMERLGRLAVWDLFGMSVLFLAAFFNLVALNADKENVAMDGQVMLKLAIVAAGGLYGGICLLTDSRVRGAAFSFPLAWVLVIFALFVASSILKSATPHAALVSSFSVLSIYLLAIASAINFGRLSTIKIVFFGTSLFIVGSWMAYFLVPSIGIFDEPITDGEFTRRMAGLAHPNTLGQFSAICCVLGVSLYCSYGFRSWIVPAIVCLSLAALLNSMSRTSTVATGVALLVAYRHLWFGRNAVRRFSLLGAGLVLGLMWASTVHDLGGMIESRLETVSKSGDADEITTATGRSEIWAKSIQLIGWSPLLGYGPTSSKFLLEEYSMYTHNLWLNVGLSCGIVGIGVAIIMCLNRIWLFFKFRNPIADGLVTFVMVNGIFENVIFSNICGLPTLCWILGSGWFHLAESGHGSES